MQTFEERLQLNYDKGERYFEDKAVPDATIDDIDMDFVKEYADKIDYGKSPLEYLKEKTNIQMIVMTTTEKLSDKKAVEQYYLLVEDEAHVLLIVPPEGSRHPFYYAIGDDADFVINDNAISYLVDQVENSRNGEYWKQELYSFADKLLERYKKEKKAT